MEPDPQVVELLVLLEEARAAGRSLTPEELSAGHPELLDAVRAGLSLLRRFDAKLTELTCDAVDAAPRPPSGHPRYQFRMFIAQGGMGEVWRGTDTVLGRDVALKVLGRRPFARDSVPRFHEEARLISRLEHPGIVPVHDLGELPDGRPFFVMKLIEGCTLADLLKERPGSCRGRWLQVFERICQAVAFAHDRNVLHRDLKPSNVMVSASGEVFVLDWGIAKLFSEPSQPRAASEEETTDQVAFASEETDTIAPETSRTRTGHVKGTAAYMAPEQALGQISQVSTRSDVFGLGGILCIILTGQPPYEGRDGLEVLHKAEKGDLTAAYARINRCGADPGLIALAKRCLTPEASQRPCDAAELGLALADWKQLDRLRGSVPPAGPLTRAALSQPYLFTLVPALLPHGVGAALVTGYVLLWAASDPVWHTAVGALTWLMLGYSAGALLVTGIVSTVLTRPIYQVLGRLRAGASVSEAEAAEARRHALLLHTRGLALCGLGWFPGGILLPWILGFLVQPADGAVVVQFLLSFGIAGLIAMPYCTLATDFFVLRIAYPKLWLIPKDLAATVARELRAVPARLHSLPLLAALVPLAASLAVMVNLNTADPVTSTSAASRLLQGLMIVLVVLGMIGCVLAGLGAHFLRVVVSGYTARADPPPHGKFPNPDGFGNYLLETPGEERHPPLPHLPGRGR